MDRKTLSGRYVLGRLLGEGGMGAVYEADDLEQKRRVAVKLINPELPCSKSLRRRFEREAKAASAIETEHIARVLDTGTDPETGAPFMVIEYLHGEDLGQLLDRLGPLPPALALRIAAQACVGLQKAHEAGVMHRDIKPGNLFLARREEDSGIVVKLLDFGIAKIKQGGEARAETTGLTRSGTMLGTPLYMSPEQARGIKTIDHRTDIWSLGIVLYRALAGRAPNEHLDAFGDLITAIIVDEPRPLQHHAPWVSPAIAAVVHAALQRDPDARYPSPSAMLDAIKPLLGGEDWSIDASMLVPLDPSHRLGTAATLDASTAPLVPEPPAVDVKPIHASERYPDDERTRRELATTEAALPPRPWPAAKPLAIGAVVVLVAGGLGLYRNVAPRHVAATGVRSAIPELRLSPSIPGAVSSSSSAPPPVASVRWVELTIVPTDASVEIDGVTARVKGGKVHLDGALGSTHRVRVSKDKITLEERVLITETGALPATLELGSAPATAARGKTPPPVTTPRSSPSVKPSATSNPLMPAQFD